MNINLAPKDEEYQQILFYTLQTWGEEQLEIYDKLLDNALTGLTENPQKERKHPKLPSNFRYFHVGRHIL
jgi:toxin ParE1/3/4